MRILYGVVGEGMGHAMRSRVVLDDLVERHDVQVVVSGRAYDYLNKRASEHLAVKKIWGLTIVAEDNEVNFELVRDVLELDGHAVTWARDGARALDIARTSSPSG